MMDEDRQTACVRQAVAKCAQIVLGARIWQCSAARPPPDTRSARWFLLQVEELAGLSQQLEPWRRDVWAPLFIEVSIQPWDTSALMPPSSAGAAGSSTGGGAGSGSMLLERWCISFSPGLPPDSSAGGSRTAVDMAAVYKRLILLLRSLYCYVRVLPAYRLYRACKRHGGELFNTRYSLSSSSSGGGGGELHVQQQQQQQQAQPGGGGRAAMSTYAFAPVQTAAGVFAVSVEYTPATAVHILEQTTLPLAMPRIITDYVDGSYARSAPHPGGADAGAAGRGSRASGPGASGRSSGLPSAPDGLLARLQSPQHHTAPLVRHSWSSRDVSAPPVVLRGFSPAAGSSMSGSSHGLRRTSSQGSGSGIPAGPASPSHGPQQAAASSPAAPGLAGPGQALCGSTGTQSPLAAGAGAGWGRPPLPHSPATPMAAREGAGFGSCAAAGAPGFSSSLPAYPGLTHASPGTPPSGLAQAPLLRSSSLSTAAALGAAAATGPRAGGSVLVRPAQAAHAAQTQQSSPLGRHSSLGSSPAALAQQWPAAAGFTSLQHYQQAQQRVAPDAPQLRQQGFHVRPVAASGSSPASAAEQEQPQLQQQPEQQLERQLEQTQQPGGDAPDEPSLLDGRGGEASPAAGASSRSVSSGGSSPAQAASDSGSPGMHAVGTPEPGSGDSGGGARAVSAPVQIPSRGSKGMRARSVTDLSLIEAESAAAAAAAAAAGQPACDAGGGWRLQQRGGAAAGVPGDSGAGGDGAGSGVKPSCSSGLLRVHQVQLKQQQLVQAPSSAPAAPRGMLGQLLSASSVSSGQTSPGFSPPGACGHRGGGSRAMAAALATAAEQRRAAAAACAGASVLTAPVAAAGKASAGGTSAAGARSSEPTAPGGEPPTRAPAGPAGCAAEASGAADRSDGASSSNTPAGAIIIQQPNPLLLHHHAALAAAAAAGTCSPGGSSGSSAPNSLGRAVLGGAAAGGAGSYSRAPGYSYSPAGAGGVYALCHASSGPYSQLALAAQPGTPGGALGSSPQLPFAFTPSGASLGASSMALADPQRRLLPAGGGGARAPAGPGTRLGLGPPAGAAAAQAVPRDGGGAAPGRVGAAAGLAGSVSAGGSLPGVGTPSPPGAACAYGPGAAAGPLGAGQGSAAAAALNPGAVSCIRDISGLATIRRPSWSSRSSSFDVGACSSLPHHLSLSPGMAELLDPALMLGCSSSQGSSSGTTAGAGPAQQQQPPPAAGARAGRAGRAAPAAPSDGGAPGQHEHGGQQQGAAAPLPGAASELPGAGTASGAHAPALQGAPAAAAGGGPGGGVAATAAAGGLGHDAALLGLAGSSAAPPDDSESDLLPFVLDADPISAAPQQGAPQQGAPQQGASQARHHLDAAGAAHDVAVGAFVQLVQDAAAAPLGRLDRRHELWQALQAAPLGAGGPPPPPLCVGDAVAQVQQLACQLRLQLFPDGSECE